MGAPKATIIKLLDRFMNRWVELWNDKEIATTLAAPCAIRTAVGRKIWSIIPRNTFIKKLVNKCGCLKHHVGGYSGRVVTLSPPTSEAGVRFLAQPQVGKLVVACCWSAVYSTEP